MSRAPLFVRPPFASSRPSQLPRAKGRTQSQAAGRMNKGEAAYALILDQRLAAGHIVAWWFELLSIRLADSTHYKPDFLVMLADGTLEIHEVKGRKRGKATSDGTRAADTFWVEEDAWAKVKIAAGVSPFPIRIVFPIGDGHWGEEVL